MNCYMFWTVIMSDSDEYCDAKLKGSIDQLVISRERDFTIGT